MKVLSLREPWATLIMENKKLIETRSWKTSYKGELYIHASSTRIPKGWKDNKGLMSLVDVEDMKKNNPQEYICGEYNEGRYAWILEDIEALDTPIKVKGHLGIWNYEA